MSETSFPLTRAVFEQQTADALDHYIGPHCGEVYLTARSMFSEFEQLKFVPIYLDNESSFISAGANVNGDIGIWVGQKEETLTPTIKLRVVERFGLPSKFIEMPHAAFMPFIFAHEVGHVIQCDQNFEKYFGFCDFEIIIPENNYEGYVNSDIEVNADYIAASIIANTSFGADLDFKPPIEDPLLWRKWGGQHSVPSTIELYKSLHV